MLRKLLPVGGLLGLCLIWAVGWVRADLQPGASGRWSLTPLLAQASLLGLTALAAGIAAGFRSAGWPPTEVAGKAALVGIGLFVAPAVFTTFARDRVDDVTRVALLSLTPLFAVVLEPYLGTGIGEAVETRGAFLPAMVAIVGTFLVFPVQMPQSYGAAFAMLGLVGTAFSIAAANCEGVAIVRRGSSVLTFTVAAAGSAALVLGFAALIFPGNEAGNVPFDAWAITDVVALALLFWLMPRMNAVQMTTRFVIAPLIANLISLALLRPHVQIQSWIGLSLIAGGSVWLLFASAASGENSNLTLRAR